MLVSSVFKHIATGAVSLGFNSRLVKSGTVSPTARHRCDVSSELCCSGAEPLRWAPSLFAA